MLNTMNGRILQKVRKQVGWSLGRLAKEARLSIRQLQRLEGTEKCKVRDHTLELICKALNVTAEQLAGGGRSMKPIIPRGGRTRPMHSIQKFHTHLAMPIISSQNNGVFPRVKSRQSLH